MVLKSLIGVPQLFHQKKRAREPHASAAGQSVKGFIRKKKNKRQGRRQGGGGKFSWSSWGGGGDGAGREEVEGENLQKTGRGNRVIGANFLLKQKKRKTFRNLGAKRGPVGLEKQNGPDIKNKEEPLKKEDPYNLKISQTLFGRGGGGEKISGLGRRQKTEDCRVETGDS